MKMEQVATTRITAEHFAVDHSLEECYIKDHAGKKQSRTEEPQYNKTGQDADVNNARARSNSTNTALMARLIMVSVW